MAATSLEGRTTCPFLLKLFYRTGAFHRPDEFASPQLPAFVPVYALPTSSLDELAHHLATAEPAVLPSPAVGTRVAFRLVYADTRHDLDGGSGGHGAPTRFQVRDIGSVVIGGTHPDFLASLPAAGALEAADEGRTTLADRRFVVGDYISCAILPPLADGSVAPASSARAGRGHGIGEGRTSALPPDFGSGRGRRDDFRRSKRGGAGPGAGSWGDMSVPTGEWRRGERVPDDGPGRGRGGRGRGARW